MSLHEPSRGQRGRWGQGLTAAKMKNCIWLRPEAVALFRFLEWTPNDHLRHASFVAMREHKAARGLVKEGDTLPARKPPGNVPKKVSIEIVAHHADTLTSAN